MPANVESMFYVRETPWHGLGTMVMEAPDSKTALGLAGLDWTVIQKPIETWDGIPITGFKTNLQNTDNRILGVVTDRYKVVQNEDAFAFTNELLGEGVAYETAGALQEFQGILEMLGLEKRRFHDLRHTFISLLIKESQRAGDGISILEVSAIAGHSDPTVTMKICGGLFPNSTERAMKILDTCNAIKLPALREKDGKSCA